MSENPTILAIVLNYRTADLTIKAVEYALREMTDLNGQVTIVDNDSGDGSYERILDAAQTRGWLASGRVQVIKAPRNGGYGAGNNIGIRAGMQNGQDADFIYVLNSDAFPDEGAIHALMEHLQENPTHGLAGSFIHGPDGAPHSTAFRFPSIISEFEAAACTGVFTRLFARHVVSLPIPIETETVDWLAGASLMIRREVLEQVGLFDEGFFLYFEETDLCRRAQLAGWATAYVRDSSVTHIGSVSTGMKRWDRVPQYWFDSRLRYFTKAHGRVYAGCATLAHIAGALVYRLRCLVSNKPRVDPKYFLRDLIWHAICAPFRSRRSGTGVIDRCPQAGSMKDAA